jgi:hypothetical protein
MLELGLVEPPEPDTPGPFRLADRERVYELVTAAGLDEPEVDDVRITMRYGSLEDYWDVTRDLSMSLRAALDRMTTDEAAELRARVEDGLAAHGGANDLAIPGLARVFSTRRPG